MKKRWIYAVISAIVGLCAFWGIWWAIENVTFEQAVAAYVLMLVVGCAKMGYSAGKDCE